jgi:hypothetical protein
VRSTRCSLGSTKIDKEKGVKEVCAHKKSGFTLNIENGF